MSQPAPDPAEPLDWRHPPVLTLSGLLADAGSVPKADREPVADVLEMLDVIDDDTATDSFLLYEWAPVIAAAMRALLEPHRPDQAGRCTNCPASAPWPCPPWQAAHRWMFELDAEAGGRRDIEGYWVVNLRGA